MYFIEHMEMTAPHPPGLTLLVESRVLTGDLAYIVNGWERVHQPATSLLMMMIIMAMAVIIIITQMVLMMIADTSN